MATAMRAERGRDIQASSSLNQDGSAWKIEPPTERPSREAGVEADEGFAATAPEWRADGGWTISGGIPPLWNAGLKLP
ncbi:MAG: hypothetical protein V4636_24065 [Pseudomonadota bacterium]